MWTNTSSLIILALTAFAIAQAHGIGAAPTGLDGYLNGLDEKQAELERELDQLMKKFYWDQQELARGALLKADKLSANQLREISNLFSEIEYTKYAVRSVAIQKGGKKLKKAFNRRLEDSELILDAELTPVLLSRLELRSVVDGYKSTALKWNELYLLMRSSNSKSSAPIQSLMKEIFTQRSEYGRTALSVMEKLNENLEAYCKSKGYTVKQNGPIILIALDRVIDSAMGCAQCAELFEPDDEVYDAYPMFSDYSQVDQLAQSIVDPKLLESISASRLETRRFVKRPLEEDIEAVDELDIADLQEDVVGSP